MTIQAQTLRSVLNELALSNTQKKDIARRVEGFNFTPMDMIRIPDALSYSDCIPDEYQGTSSVADIIQYPTSQANTDKECVRVIIFEEYHEYHDKERTMDPPQRLLIEICEPDVEHPPITLINGSFLEVVRRGLRDRITALTNEHNFHLESASAVMQRALILQSELN